jgi:hypothetical protein
MVVDTNENSQLIAAADRDATAGALLTRVRLRAQRRLLWMRSVSNQFHEQSVTALAISPEEVERILDDPGQTAAREEMFYETDAAARQLSEQIGAADREFFQETSWRQLRLQFALSDFETDLLSLVVAAGADPSLLRVYAYLHDDAGAAYVTPRLVACLFGSQSQILSPESALVKWRLARPLEQGGNSWVANAPWMADPHIMLWLMGSPLPDPVLTPSVQFLPKEESSERICLYPDELVEMLKFLRAIGQDSDNLKEEPAAIQIELIGGVGTGKRTLAAQFAASLGADLIAVDAELLLAPDVPWALARERVVHAIRMARLSGALLYWHNGERLSARVWQAIEGTAGVMLFGSQGLSISPGESSAIRRSIQLPVLRKELQVALWNQLSLQPPPHIIAEWALTPAEIARAARMAPAGQNAVIEACQETVRLKSSELFTPLACPFAWDDIVLPPHLRQHLAELQQQVRLRAPVYEEWGFQQLCPLGRGITALFSGPSGTGKTMAAQVLARSLDYKLYRVDLSGVMNKYIGETEKRLKQVFDACERANVLLFFDEADALFGQRTQVKDAHDRFANIEIDYLLQRMEQFEGVAILATNRRGDLDKAFVRRIRFILDFVPPGPVERVALWRRALLARSPGGEELLDPIDFNFLANKLNMTGADITASALGAAFLARAEGKRICMAHILHAARREMSKHGMVVRVGEWEN